MGQVRQENLQAVLEGIYLPKSNYYRGMDQTNPGYFLLKILNVTFAFVLVHEWFLFHQISLANPPFQKNKTPAS